MKKKTNFIEIAKSKKIWAIGSIHSRDIAFESIKKYLLKKFKTKIIPCKTIRYKNTFPYSSRNKLLLTSDLKNCIKISKILKKFGINCKILTWKEKKTNSNIKLKKFCEEKQLGIDSITDIVGMPRIEDDEKWGVIVSKLQKGKDKWKLVKLKQNGVIKYETADEKMLDLKIENYSIVDDYHTSFLVEDHLNKAVEI